MWLNTIILSVTIKPSWWLYSSTHKLVYRLLNASLIFKIMFECFLLSFFFFIICKQLFSSWKRDWSVPVHVRDASISIVYFGMYCIICFGILVSVISDVVDDPILSMFFLFFIVSRKNKFFLLMSSFLSKMLIYRYCYLCSAITVKNWLIYLIPLNEINSILLLLKMWLDPKSWII